MQYRTLADLSDLIRNNIHRIPHDVDLLVGIPRSGMLPANMIALFLNKRLTDIDTFIQGRTYNAGERGQYINNSPVRKVLVVDDSVATGAAMTLAKNKLAPLTDKFDFLFMAPIVSSCGKDMVDIYCEVIDDCRFFEWNVFHHGLLKNACVDIDGVLNTDPEYDDDGPVYMQFLHNATPLFVPSVPVGTLVTCRLEKYRQPTEEWLKKYNVLYDNLIMLPFSSKEERLKWGKHGEYKARYYAQSQCILFIESSKQQADIIANISHKHVFCVETNELIYIPVQKHVTLSKRFRRAVRRRFPDFYAAIKRFFNI